MRIRIPLAVKIAVSAAIMVAVSLSVFGYFSFREHRALIVNAAADSLAAVVRNAAPLADAEAVKRRSPQDMSLLTRFLDTLDERNPAIREFHIVMEANGRPHLLAAGSGSAEARASEGKEYTADEAVLDAFSVCISRKEVCSTGLYTDVDGTWISAAAPIIDAQGALAGVLMAKKEAAEVRREAGAIVGQLTYNMAGLVVVVGLLGVYLSVRITRPLAKLYNASRRAREGHFEPIEVTGTDEVATLMRDFNETNRVLEAKMRELALLNRELEQRVESRTDQLSKSYEELRERQQILQREMAVARRVQETIIPRSINREKISIDVEYVPIMEIGGDLGIVVEQGPDRFDVAIGDVTGHGIGAALVVNRVHTLLSQLYAVGAPLDSLFHRLDYFLSREIADIGIFLTIAACRFDLGGMSLEYGGGGHLPGILYRPSRDSLEHLASSCGILGTGTPWCDEPPVMKVPIHSGDFVVLYTDGLVDATDKQGTAFGQKRLEDTIRAAARKGNDGKTIAKSLTQATKDFTGGYFQDDVLILVAGIK